jgi:hypoxanthine phosphoribosyltransferase
MSSPIHVPEKGLDGPSPEDLPPGPLRERIERILIPEETLRARVRELAREIVSDLAGARRLDLLAVLEGARTFAGELAREIEARGGPGVEISHIRARAYGEEIKREGESRRPVRILSEPPELRGRQVLLVDDIVDQGFTLETLQGLVLEGSPASLRSCVLLVKRLERPSPAVRRLRARLRVDYAGFEVPDRWVAGHGLDLAGELRDLPHVVAVSGE